MNSKNCVLLDTPQLATKWLKSHHENARLIGFVPTMGALHDGHISLVRKAVEQNDFTCVSIFVNPLQFNNPDDLDKYPRDLDKDLELLRECGCDMVFTGTLANFFPEIEHDRQIPIEDPGPLAQGLEGEFRPGHFAGVRTIVKRLFETVGHCSAYFGAKDFQQALVIKALARELGFPQIVVCPTMREENGLAMSSRNEHLTNEQRQVAGKIFQSLSRACIAWQDGQRNAEKLKTLMMDALQHPDIKIEYVELRDPNNWNQGSLSGELSIAPQALIAIELDEVRLIDNTMIGMMLKDTPQSA